MRIQQQLSIILFVAVVGAIGLAVIVGTLLGGVEQAARRLEIAASQQRQMELVVAQAHTLREAVAELGTRSSDESFVVVDQTIDQSMVHLARMRHVPLAFDAETVDRAWRSLERTRTLAAERSAGVQHPDDLEQLHRSVDAYLRCADEAGLAAATAVNRQAVSVARRRLSGRAEILFVVKIFSKR